MAAAVTGPLGLVGGRIRCGKGGNAAKPSARFRVLATACVATSFKEEAMPDENSITGSGAVTTGGPIVDLPELRQRPNLAAHFLHSAVKAARRAKVAAENAHTGHGPWFTDMLHDVPTAVIMSASAIEAHTNEAIQDYLDGGPKIEDEKKEFLQVLKDNRMPKTTEKCQEMIRILGVSKQARKINWNQVSLLMEFRNSLVHFRPVWSHDVSTDSALKKKLIDSKVSIYKPCEDQFPLCFMNYSASKWAINTALKFIGDIAPVLGFVNRFEGQDYKLP
jgi:hypothetical protein